MNDLIHFGVKGMRWGHRKQPELSGPNSRSNIDDGRIVVRKKGEELHHISGNPNLSPGVRELYTSFTKKDVLTYRSHYADQLRAMNNIDKIYDYKLVATRELVAPSQKKKIDTLINLVKDEPAILSEIAKNKLSCGLIMQTAKALGFKSQQGEAKKYREQLKSKDPEVQSKMLKDFVKYMILSENARTKYIRRLEKQGFNSMYDDNDMLAGFSEKPLIVFNSKKNLKIKSKEMDDQDATDVVFSELEKLIKETD